MIAFAAKSAASKPPISLAQLFIQFSQYRNKKKARNDKQRVVSFPHKAPDHLTRIIRQLVVYFCLHRGKCAGKHGKLASANHAHFVVAV